MLRKYLNRVDFQVAIITSVIVAFSSLLIFFTTYSITYNDMITSLQDRVSAIYYGIEPMLDSHDFTNIDDKRDISLQSYQEIQQILLQAKQTSGVMYLYTAKQLDDGSLVYLVDGLPMSSQDYRYPGDLIEQEIQDEMQFALDNQILMPQEIKHTSWGHIFIAYLPITHNDEVIGVLGVEFDAGHQYSTYRLTLIGMVSLIIIFCIAAWYISFKLFGRISNPTYKDLYNTDLLSGLKNRNSFDIDIGNLDGQKRKNIGVLSIDLDNLKTTNDTLGHHEGDKFIISCVYIIQEAIANSTNFSNNILYRVGGDEFAIIMHDIDENSLNELCHLITTKTDKANESGITNYSLSIGKASFDINEDRSLLDTFKRADNNMYEIKRTKKCKESDKS